MRILLGPLLLPVLACAQAQQDPAPSATKTFKVFLLAGQSNMEGQAVADLDHEEHYNGGRGTLVHLLDDPRVAERLAHLRAEDGRFAVRDDVFCWYQPERGDLKAGPLSVGFAVYPGRHHFGPELELGHVVGDAVDEPVLLIKTAWGGKSLYTDFRSPVRCRGPIVAAEHDGVDAARRRRHRLRDHGADGRRPGERGGRAGRHHRDRTRPGRPSEARRRARLHPDRRVE